MVFSTGHLTGSSLLEVLNQTRHPGLKDECPMAELSELTEAERVHTSLWKRPTQSEAFAACCSILFPCLRAFCNFLVRLKEGGNQLRILFSVGYLKEINNMSYLLSSDIYLQVPLYVHPRRPPASLAPWCSSPAEALGALEAGGCPNPVFRCPARQMCTERHPLGKQK